MGRRGMSLRAGIRRTLLSAVEVIAPPPRDPRPGTASTNQGKLDVYGFPFSWPGMSKAWTGVYTTYRQMNAVPTIALCRAATRATMKSAEWSVEADDDAPGDAVEVLQRMFLRRR